MKDNKIFTDIAKLLAGECSKAERKEKLARIEASPEYMAHYLQLKEVWDQEESADEFSPEVPTAWQEVKKQTLDKDQKPNKTNVFFLRPVWRYAAAAILLLIVSVFWFFPVKPEVTWAEVSTQAGQQETIDLPDGSRVTLNANTRLSYPESFKQRHVKLAGEAFFEVERDEQRPFSVFSGATQTKVLGTAFNVRAFPDENRIDVWVDHGKVAVATLEGTSGEVVLEKGEAAVWTPDSKQIKRITAPHWQANSWKTQFLQFEDNRLEHVAISLSRYFDKEFVISTPGLAQCRFTGNYQNPNLEEILNILAYAMDIQTEVTNDTIKLSGPPCN